MELVEGEALRGPLPLDQALPVLRQLIDGIEAAHEKGITHRDLKPANIRITPDGVVKILDFGLAKLTDAGTASGSGSAEPRVALSQSPTMASPTMLTGAGMILGMAAYMAPEQARGKPADHRADVGRSEVRDRHACAINETAEHLKTAAEHEGLLSSGRRQPRQPP